MDRTEEAIPVLGEMHDTELARFAQSFQNERALHQRLETLFSKVDRISGVKILQGSQEYGKDLIFYEQGPFGKRRLVACVVKNDRITGSVSSRAGASTVYFQIRQALTIPYVGVRGEEEFVSYVYVISPFSCSPEAMHSIRGELRKGEQNVEFLCGRDLFELFRVCWPAYIYLDSNLLLVYVASLDALNENSALSNAITRAGFAVEGIASLSQMYIWQEFAAPIVTFELAYPFPSYHRLTEPLLLSESHQLDRELQDTASLLTSALSWSQLKGDEIKRQIEVVQSLRLLLRTRWEEQYQKAVEFAAPPPKKLFRAVGIFDARARSQIEGVVFLMATLHEEISKCCEGCLGLSEAAGMAELSSDAYISFSRLRLASIQFPWAIVRQETIKTLKFGKSTLDSYSGPLLVTGSAGFGKTSFCRMAALRDAKALFAGERGPMPVYVPLHQLNSREVKWDENPMELFIPGGEIRELFRGKIEEEAAKIRIYLDGLDEITDLSKRGALMRVANSASKSGTFQIIVTARDHVAGDYLSWMPCVALAPLDHEQIYKLASKWLTDSELNRFVTEIERAPELRSIVSVPLLANLTFAIFKEIGTLPESIVRLYEIFVPLLCGGWDAAKNIRRDSEFGPLPKRTVVTRLAWICHSSRKRDFGEREFRAAVRHTLNELENKALSLLLECIQDGVLIRVGDAYTFAHHSFQEFLVSKDLNDPNGKRQRLVLKWYLEGDSWWDDVLRFYVGSAENPQEIADWIFEGTAQTLRRSNSPAADINQRAKRLIDTLESYHKGFRPPAEAMKNINEITRLNTELSKVKPKARRT